MELSPSWKVNSSAASKNFPHFCGTWRFITVLTSARHLSFLQALPYHFSDVPLNIILAYNEIHLRISFVQTDTQHVLLLGI